MVGQHINGNIGEHPRKARTDTIDRIEARNCRQPFPATVVRVGCNRRGAKAHIHAGTLPAIVRVHRRNFYQRRMHPRQMVVLHKVFANQFPVRMDLILDAPRKPKLAQAIAIQARRQIAKLYNYDTQHGLTLFALLCKFGLIKEVKPEDYLDAQYASYTIQNASAGLPAYSAMTKNGLGQKKWSSYDHHKTKVGLARQYPAQYGKMFEKESNLQDLCELYEAIPVGPQSSYTGKAGTISRVDALHKYEFNQVEFTLERHKAHWHGTHFDDAAYGFYGNMIVYSKSVGWTKKELTKLSDHLNAIVFDFFTDLAGARTVVVNTHERWFKACNPLAKKVPSPTDDCFLAIIQKMYLKLNGSQVTSHAYNFIHNGKDIYDYLPEEIKHTVDSYAQIGIDW